MQKSRQKRSSRKSISSKGFRAVDGERLVNIQ